MENLDLIFENALKEAALGKKTWIYLTEKYALGKNGSALLLPTKTPRYHEDSVGLLPEYMKKTGIHTAVILMETGRDIPGWLEDMIDSGIVKIMENNSMAEQKDDKGSSVKTTEGEGIFLHFLLKEEMEALVRFYSLYEFTDRLIIGSLEIPAGRQGAAMIGKKGLTLREAVGAMLYDIYL